MIAPSKRVAPLLALSLRQLLYFVTVARTGSFTETAAELSVTQPALSAGIRQMEELLGSQIFDRASHPVGLTELGREILPLAEHLLETARVTYAGMKDSARLRQHTVRVSMLPSAVGRVIPLLGQIAGQNPDIRLEIRDVVNPGPTDDVLSGASDIGVGVASGDERLVEWPLFEDPLVVVMPEEDVLALRQSVPWSALHDRNIAMFQFGDIGDWLGKLRDRNEVPQLTPRYKTEYLASLCEMVRARLAITVLPMMYGDVLFDRQLVMRPLEEPSITRPIALLRKRKPAHSAAVDACFEALHSALSVNAPST